MACIAYTTDKLPDRLCALGARQAEAVEQRRDGVQHRGQLAGLQDAQVALQRGQELEVVARLGGQLRPGRCARVSPPAALLTAG